MAPLHLDLRRVLADRHGPEAAAVFRTLLGFVARRVEHLARARCGGLLTDADKEEIIGEVLFRLMDGALARFRGETMAELFAFVRTMADRTATRRAQRRLRERNTVADLATAPDGRWVQLPMPGPDNAVDFAQPSPLDHGDQTYLTELLRAGSKAELARRQGVSRAAVTQRVARIRDRIAQLPARQRAAHEAWMQRRAQDVLEEGCEPLLEDPDAATH